MTLLNWLSVMNCTNAPVKNDSGAAEDDQPDGDDAQGRCVDWADFIVTNSVNGYDNHVDGVSEAPADGHVGRGGDDHHGNRVADADDQIAHRRVEQARQLRLRDAAYLARLSRHARRWQLCPAVS